MPSSRWPTWSRSSGRTKTTTSPTIPRGRSSPRRTRTDSTRRRSGSTTSSASRSWPPRSPARRRWRSCTARWPSCPPSDRCASSPAVSKFFNGNPGLGALGGGIDAFAGRTGRKQWAEIEAAIGRSWDNVVDAIDELVSTPDVDAAASKKAEDELAEPAPEPEVDEEAVERRSRRPTRPTRRRCQESDDLDTHAKGLVLGSDDDFWLKVGIDPVRMMTSARHLLHAALLSRRPADLPGPQRKNQRVRLRACARALSGRRARPRPFRPGHLRRHPHGGHRRLATGQHHRRQRLRADRDRRRPRRRPRRDRPRPARARRRIAQGRRRIRRGHHRRGNARRGSAAGPGGRPRARSGHRPPPERRRMPRPSSSGRRWRRSWNRGCGPDSATARSL